MELCITIQSPPCTGHAQRWRSFRQRRLGHLSLLFPRWDPIAPIRDFTIENALTPLKNTRILQDLKLWHLSRCCFWGSFRSSSVKYDFFQPPTLNSCTLYSFLQKLVSAQDRTHITVASFFKQSLCANVRWFEMQSRRGMQREQICTAVAARLVVISPCNKTNVLEDFCQRHASTCPCLNP